MEDIYPIQDYSKHFATSWRHYSDAIEALVGAGSSLVLIECEETGRRSFLSLVKKRSSFGKGAYLLDLKSAYYDSRPNIYEFNPSVLHDWIIRQIQPPGEDLISRISLRADDLTYRGIFQEALRYVQHSGPEIILMLDEFDFLLDALLKEVKDRRKVAEMLSYWTSLSKNNEIQVRIVLGGDYACEKHLQECFAAFYQQLSILRPDNLALHDAGKSEITTFILEALKDLTPEQRLSCEEGKIRESIAKLVEASGGNLTCLQHLVVAGLRAALRQPELIQHGEAALQHLEHSVIAHGIRTGFFTSRWWRAFSFYEKILLALAAHAEFPIRYKSWLGKRAWHVNRIRISRDYHSRSPSGAISGLVLSEGEVLTESICTKITRNKYYRVGDACIEGWIRGHLCPPEDFSAQMLSRLVDLEKLRDNLVRQEVLEAKQMPAPVHAFYDFKIRFLKLWIRQTHRLELFREATEDPSKSWYSRQDLIDPTTRKRIPLESSPKPVCQMTPLSDLPRIHQTLQKEDYDLFYNFYGIAAESLHQRQDKWRALVALANRINEYRNSTHPTGMLMTELFRTLASMTQLASSARTMADVHWKALTEQEGLAWNLYALPLGEVFPGFQPEVAVTVVRDGETARPYTQQLMNWLSQQVFPPDQYAEGRNLIIILVLSHCHPFLNEVKLSHQVERLRCAVFDTGEMTQVCIDSDPQIALLRLCRNKVGRHPFSPYRTRGVLPPGSELFVGRDREIARVKDSIDTQDYIIIGNRRIGKTSLLRQIQVALTQTDKYNVFAIDLHRADDAQAFYTQLRGELRRLGHANYLNLIEDENNLDALGEMLKRLFDDTNRQAVFCLDDIDQLYFKDFHENGERFFGFLRRLTTHEPRFCSFVMTGYPRIYIQNFDPRSVFFNFGGFINIAEIDYDSARRLVNALSKLDVTFYHPTEGVDRLVRDTYAIPWILQTVCDALLKLLDDEQRGNIEYWDIDAVIEREVVADLKHLLIDFVEAEIEPTAAELSRYQESTEISRLRMQLILLVAVIGEFDYHEDAYRQDRVYSRRRLKHQEERYFSTEQVISWLDDWITDELKQYWHWTPYEIEKILTGLTMTLAVAPGPKRSLFYFPQNVLPNVLFKLQGSADYDLLKESYDLQDTYVMIVQTQRHEI